MSYNKRDVTQLISKRIGYITHSAHIASVINILLDEIGHELKTGRSIEIDNFGTFELSKIKSKSIQSVVNGIEIVTKPATVLRFRLSRKLKKWLSNK
jgi:nucleoid DNA-binding protein